MPAKPWTILLILKVEKQKCYTCLSTCLCYNCSAKLESANVPSIFRKISSRENLDWMAKYATPLQGLPEMKANENILDTSYSFCKQI